MLERGIHTLIRHASFPSLTDVGPYNIHALALNMRICVWKTKENRKKMNQNLQTFSKEINPTHYGFPFPSNELCNSMPLWFLEGAEGGNGTAFGKNPKRL
ncbi:uncharacterized protein DS421_15g523770 [Arachis hypogaea]|nr:uncharacterized protein DS421_15g523770 [Arachis hypogaea]